MERLTIKRSTIFISVGDKTQVYRSVEEVPPTLRKKLQESTNGINAATILIADRRGRDEIVRAIRGLPSGIRGRIVKSIHRPETVEAGRQRLDWRTWVEILLPGAVGLLIWLAFNYK
jgi:hypothetical protein